MSAKKLPMDQSAASNVSPFEQITGLENEQEARVSQTLERAEEEKREAEKMNAHAEKTQETMMREKATEELKEYARTEPANILQSNEKATIEEVEALKKHADKQLNPTAERLLKPVLDGSLFSISA